MVHAFDPVDVIEWPLAQPLDVEMERNCSEVRRF